MHKMAPSKPWTMRERAISVWLHFSAALNNIHHQKLLNSLNQSFEIRSVRWAPNVRIGSYIFTLVALNMGHHRALYLALSHLLCTQPLAEISFGNLGWTSIFRRMILSCMYHSIPVYQCQRRQQYIISRPALRILTHFHLDKIGAI